MDSAHGANRPTPEGQVPSDRQVPIDQCVHRDKLWTKCQCEHEKHFPSSEGGTGEGHPYQEYHPDTDIVLVRFPGAGSFLLCTHCAEHCHG